ncbi:ankyrin, partial [Nadsonia fulvescens var. elongata DSM 6958]
IPNIWIAASDNNLDAVKHHIENGATPNDKDPNGYTPMHAAASYGHLDLLKYLVSKGGDINVADTDGDRPLHTIEEASTAKFIVEELGADYRLKNADGQTALEKIEEEEEFPEVAAYLRTISGVPAVIESSNSGNSAANLPDVRYSYENVENSQDMDEEQRKRIETIMQSENPEEGMAEMIRESL